MGNRAGPLRVAVLGAPGTGKKTLLQALQQAAASPGSGWQLVHDHAALQALESALHQAPDEATRQQAISAYLQLGGTAEVRLLCALDYTCRASAAAMARRALLDASLRRALDAQQWPFSTLYGDDATRVQAALQVIAQRLQPPAALPPTASRWRWACEKCSDPDCEHRLFRDLVTAGR